MKKLLFAVLCLGCLSSFTWGGQWGAGVKVGVGQNDPKTLEALFDHATAYDRKITRSGGFFAVEVLHEWDFQSPANKIGLKLGADIYGENELKIYGLGTATEETYAIPLSVYYKRENGTQEWSYSVGLGATYIDTEVDDVSDSKIFPHIMAGAEYRFTKTFALGLDLKYNIAAKVKKEGDVLSDRSGLSAALAARFYF